MTPYKRVKELDLGLNCVQRLSAEKTKVSARKEIVHNLIPIQSLGL